MSSSLGSIVGGAVRTVLPDSASSDQPSDSISLSFGKIHVEYKAQDPSSGVHTTAPGGNPLSNLVPPGGLHPIAGEATATAKEGLPPFVKGWVSERLHDLLQALADKIKQRGGGEAEEAEGD
jgi:hypothetical protein